jgi:hypothetical protein
MGKEGLEPSRLAARDPKSRLSANSSTSPCENYKRAGESRQLFVIILSIDCIHIKIFGSILLEDSLSRVIKLEGSGKERKKLTKEIVLAVRELMTQREINEFTYDLAAFISLSLDDILQTVDVTVTAWEKRGYWIKADRFRLEWEWCEIYGKTLKEGLIEEDWGKVAGVVGRIGEKLSTVELPLRHRLGEPWKGSMIRFKKNDSIN